MDELEFLKHPAVRRVWFARKLWPKKETVVAQNLMRKKLFNEQRNYFTVAEKDKLVRLRDELASEWGCSVMSKAR